MAQVIEAMSNIIGSGTYGVVMSIGTFAVKQMYDISFESSIREIAYMRACSHPNFIQLVKLESHDGTFRLTMKLFKCDLRKYLDTRRFVVIADVYTIAHDIINAVDYLHSRGIIHCDICPKNILIDIGTDSKIINVTLCDPGIAVIDTSHIMHQSHVQTCDYRAPEVDYYSELTKFSKHIDVWSLGCVLFELACAKQFYPYDSVDDTSIVVCTIMDAWGVDRATRMRELYSIKHEQVYDRIITHIGKRVHCIPGDYIKLFVPCLIPNIHMRTKLPQLLIAANKLPTRAGLLRSYNKPDPITFEQYDADDMYCMTNINAAIIVKCPHESIIYAENLYRLCIDVMSVTYTTQLACIYIASCIYDGINIDEELIKITDLETVQAEATRITIATDGNLLCL